MRAEATQQVSEARTALQTAEREIARLEAEAEAQARQLNEAQTSLQRIQEDVSVSRAAAQAAEARASAVETQVVDMRRQLDEARQATQAAQRQLLEQAQQLGELGALRRQVQEQQALIERLSSRD